MEEKANNIFESSSQSDFEIKQKEGFLWISSVLTSKQSRPSVSLTMGNVYFKGGIVYLLGFYQRRKVPMFQTDTS